MHSFVIVFSFELLISYTRGAQQAALSTPGVPLSYTNIELARYA